MSSWFYKLRRKRGGARAIASGQDPDDDGAAAAAKPVAPAPSPACPCSPNRASYYVPSRDRGALPPRPRPAMEGMGNPKLRDTRFPRSPQPGDDIVFDVVARRRDDRFKAMPELKLRPILTKPPADAGAGSDSSSGGGAASPTARVRRPRFHARPPPPPPSRRRKAAALPSPAAEKEARRRRLRRNGSLRWVYESLVVVKESAEPEEDFLESMAEMIAANGVRSPRGLEDLLACYLALNAPDHHRAIVAAFRRAWEHLHSVPPPPPPPPPPTTTTRGRCMHESRLGRLAS